MKPPCFYPISVSAHPGQLKAPLSVNIIAELIRLSVQDRSCCYFCPQWKCAFCSASTAEILLIALVPWKTSERWVCTSHPPCLRCILKAEESWGTFAGGAGAMQSWLWFQGGEQQGSASQLCLGLREQFLFLRLVFLTLPLDPCQWMVPLLGLWCLGWECYSQEWAGQGAAAAWAPGGFYFKQTAIAIYHPEKPIPEILWGKVIFGISVLKKLLCCWNKDKVIPCRA